MASPKIKFFSDSEGVSPSEKITISKWLSSVIVSEGKRQGPVGINFLNDQELLEINKKFLNHSYLTDIITFDYSDDSAKGKKPVLSGELFISLDRVKANAKKFKAPFEDELRRVMVHGILHLCGYGDKLEKEKRLMRRLENKYLREFKENFQKKD